MLTHHLSIESRNIKLRLHTKGKLYTTHTYASNKKEHTQLPLTVSKLPQNLTVEDCIKSFGTGEQYL